MHKFIFPPNFWLNQNKNSTPIYAASFNCASTFAPLFEDAAAMPARSPVFTTAVDPERFKASAVGGQSNFRIATVQQGTCYVLTFCLQVGHARFVWLADPADPEFWAAIDEAKRAGQLGFAFLSPTEPWFQAWGVPPGTSSFEQHRDQVGRGSDAFVTSALAMMKSGRAAQPFISTLPKVPITYQRTCILLTGGVMTAIASIPGVTIDRAAPLSAAT